MTTPLLTEAAAGGLTIVALLVLLGLAYVPLGDYLAAVLNPTRHARAERLIYRGIGVDPDGQQSPRSYLVAVLAFSGVSIAVLMTILMAQAVLPFSRGLPGMPWEMALNTAVSFVTNTNWQSYAGEATLGYTAQMTGLTVQNFLSAAVGIAVAGALIRALSTSGRGTIGNFWVDLVRVTVRVLLPISLVAAVVLVAFGVIQTFAPDREIVTLTGGGQTLPGGPVASQEAIKELGTNGGGFFNANSAHPYENPGPSSNLVQTFLMLLIPVALTRTFGTMVGDRRQGLALLAAMAALWAAALATALVSEVNHYGQATQAAGGALEGKETRFGVWSSVLFAVATTGTSTGAVNTMHDSLTPASGGITLVHMLLGEISPGGTGSGLYGMIIIALLSIFIAGLMVGRTPEYLGKKIGPRETVLVSLYILITPALVLVGLAVAMALPSTPDAMANDGIHGFSEVFYAYASAANNNGSAFAGLTVTSPFFQLSLALCMLVGRFAPMAVVLLLAGRLAAAPRVPSTAGTLPTHTPEFVTLVVGVVVLVAGLTFLPGLALGPLAEALA